MGPQNRPRTKISNRYNSKPEIDFVTIPTAFTNVWGATKMPLKIFRQGRWKGSNSTKCKKGHGFQPPMSRKLVNEFFKKFYAVREYECLPVCKILRKLIQGIKSYKNFLLGLTPKPEAKIWKFGGGNL